jgi:hypothetical protein
MQIVIDIITTREDIHHALVESEENQSIIGIASKDLGQGMFMTTVKEITVEAEDVLIVLNSYDTSGYFLEKNKVHLSRITGIIPFKAVFTNPFLKALEEQEPQETSAQQNNPDYIF